jgi:hypothetical protein
MFGPPKIGKTHQLFNIALWHQNIGSDAMFYGLNSDTSWETLMFNEEFQGLTNITWRDCNYFQDYVNAAREFHPLLREQDWMVLDLSDHAWQASQDEFARMKTREGGSEIEDVGDLWTVDDAPRDKDGKQKYPIEGWDWGMPNARYRILANNYMMRGQGHRLIISGATGIVDPTANMKEDDTTKRAREMFKHLGAKPAGQKDDPFRYHTVLYVDGNEAEHSQRIATAGERWGNRKWMGRRHRGGQITPEPMSDFFIDYLVNTAGWSMD